jgi:peptidyl-prolyl cis-trans isomerase D
MIIDTISQVSTSELKKYYNEHKNLYEQTRSRDISYINFPIKPSADDYLLAMEIMQKVESEFIKTPIADLGTFVNRNSEEIFDDIYHKKGELPLAVDTFAFSEELGAFLPIYQEGETYKMARISGIRNLADSVRARHILLAPENNNKADSIIEALKKGADFATLANEFSIDQAANEQGGDLKWFTFTTMVRPFSDSCFYNSKKGKIMKVHTQFGEHIIEITDKADESKHVQVAIIQTSATVGKTTSQLIFNQANTLVTESDNNQTKFEELASERGYLIQTGDRIGLNDRVFANFKNVRELVRWIYQAKTGDVSGVFIIDNDYIVIATLNKIREDGIAPFEQVKSEIEIALKREKQADIIAENLKTMMISANNSIDELAVKANLNVANVSTPINFETSYIPGIMTNEQKLLGAISAAPENILAGPVKGEQGVYVFTITNKTFKDQIEIDENSEKDRLQSAISLKLYEYYNILVKKANIKDNRGKFY